MFNLEDYKKQADYYFKGTFVAQIVTAISVFILLIYHLRK